MERILYSKYSNERAEQFCIRTDIVAGDDGERSVVKHALTPSGRSHIENLAEYCHRLNEAYRPGGITFCPCRIRARGEDVAAVFPFLGGTPLQETLERAVESGDDGQITRILGEYIRRLRAEGGRIPFTVTAEFAQVFGALSAQDAEILANAGEWAHTSAQISDIDMILPNLFAEGEDAAAEETPWQAIDYEWTFTFPIPKGFLIYRGLYFAYYQVLYRTGKSPEELLALADIGEDEAGIYRRMEEHFQNWLGSGALPVRNMQRLLGTRVIPLEELLDGSGSGNDPGSAGVLEEEWLRVRKIRFQIDREEYQDGSHVCSGWAFAETWDGRYLPVNIRVDSGNGNKVSAEISRRERQDVAQAFRIRRVSRPAWGFDCVWVAPKEADWELKLSLGRKECTYRGGTLDAGCDR